MTANRSRYDGVSLSANAKRAEDGYGYVISNRRQAPNNGGVAQWLLRTGEKLLAVAGRIITTNGDELEYLAYANPTVTDDGTPVAPAPLNIAKALPSTIEFFGGPTVSDKGTPLVPSYLPGAAGQGNRQVGNIYANEQENIIPPNTTLLLEVTNNGGANPAEVEFYAIWAEVTDPAPFA